MQCSLASSALHLYLYKYILIPNSNFLRRMLDFLIILPFLQIVPFLRAGHIKFINFSLTGADVSALPGYAKRSQRRHLPRRKSFVLLPSNFNCSVIISDFFVCSRDEELPCPSAQESRRGYKGPTTSQCSLPLSRLSRSSHLHQNSGEWFIGAQRWMINVILADVL